MRKTMFILVALVFLVTACLPGQSTQDLEARVNTAVAQTQQAQAQISGAVEQTVAAQAPLAAPTTVEDASLTATETPLAFPTFTPTALLIDTVTPLPLPTSTRRPVQQAEYACEAISRKPFDNTEFDKGDKFDIKWTIVNIGTKTWPAGIDVKYYSGQKMASTNRFEIPKEMKPGDSIVMNLDATAPNKKGFYVMTWAVDGPMCFPYTAIIVK